MNMAEEFETLLVNFDRYLLLAQQLESPNLEDNLAVKIAIAGFSCNAPTHEWAQGHYLYLKDRLDGDYSLDNLNWYEPSSKKVQLFASLCFGTVLGLFQADKATNEDVRLAEKLIPGFIALKANILATAAV